MNKAQQKPPPAAEREGEEDPASPLRKLWCRMRRKPRLAAVHEAVDELLDACDGKKGPAVERTLLDNVLSLRDKTLEDCMVPRAAIIAIEADSSWQDLVALMVEHTHSRIPVYRETLDETIGMAHMKDVLISMAQNKTGKIRDLLRPVLFMPPSMRAASLLIHMRITRQHMAMVVDEFGGIDGLVTMEDLVEEIVGDIDDEHDDPATPWVIARNDGTLLVDAAMPIKDFESYVGPLLTAKEHEVIDTVAGYVFHLVGHIPQIGQTIEGKGGILFDVLETDLSRIRRVRVRPAARAAHD
ncbi:MAG: hemolysin family protein [Alphaproteobacteria bacterium]|nr:hemolysin family protein [Alphaproteobacteria bacterium]